jgi:hypothetical protein
VTKEATMGSAMNTQNFDGEILETWKEKVIILK